MRGDLTVSSQPGKGTKVTATFQLDHWVATNGDMASTMTVLLTGRPDVDIYYCHTVNGEEFSIDTRELKTELKLSSVNRAKVLAFLKTYIKDGLS